MAPPRLDSPQSFPHHQLRAEEYDFRTPFESREPVRGLHETSDGATPRQYVNESMPLAAPLKVTAEKPCIGFRAAYRDTEGKTVLDGRIEFAGYVAANVAICRHGSGVLGRARTRVVRYTKGDNNRPVVNTICLKIGRDVKL